MIRPWVEWNPAYDEYRTYANKMCWGLFDADGFCFVGFTWTRSFRQDLGFWRMGLVIWNIGFGLWFDDGG